MSKKLTLNKCITKLNITGPCEIDRTKALKAFTERCGISKWKDEYRLFRITHRKYVSMKVTITTVDAIWLITKLGLIEHKSVLYNSGTTFLMKGVDPQKI